MKSRNTFIARSKSVGNHPPYYKASFLREVKLCSAFEQGSGITITIRRKHAKVMHLFPCSL